MSTDLNLADLLKVPKLPIYLEKVDKQMLASVKVNSPTISLSSKRLMKAGGKRLRPSLVIACSAINNAPIDDRSIQLATSVELLHIGSLVHDDIIDEALVRRNVPTVSSTEGSNQAIVVGDYLLANACAQASSVNQSAGILVAKTIIKLCDGQSLELADKANKERSVEAYFNSIEGKTASLIATCCKLGGICAGLNEVQLEALRQYGHYFGIAFQLIDDLLTNI